MKIRENWTDIVLATTAIHQSAVGKHEFRMECKESGVHFYSLEAGM